MNNENIFTENINKEKNTKSHSRKTKDDFKEKNCEVINYNKHTKTLDINFNGFGVRIKDVDSFNSNNSSIIVKYKGEIGKSNFVVKV